MSHEAERHHASSGITTDEIRRQNLSAVLRRVQRDGPLSRSQLTRTTGLNRSTIAALVSDLERRRLVVERAGEGSGRAGRPSPVVSAADSSVAVAVHPEVDAIELALVTLSGKVLHRARYRNTQRPSPTQFFSVVQAMLEGMLSAADAPRPLGVGVAVPGLVREADGVVQWAPHLHWRDVDVVGELTRRTGLPTTALNDASCGAMAEYLFGAGQGASHLVYLNGGASGIGGGVVVAGELLGGAAGYAGEFGHTLVDSSGLVCECGAIGCLETVVRRDRLVAPGAEPLSLEELRAHWGSGDMVDTELALQVRALGTALRHLANSLDPARIVLGGHLADLLALAGAEGLRAAAAPLVTGSPERLDIVGAQLGDAVLLIGAAEAVFGPIVADPTSVAAPSPTL